MASLSVPDKIKSGDGKGSFIVIYALKDYSSMKKSSLLRS